MLLPGYRAVTRHAMNQPPDCRRQRLPASTFEECAATCLAQPFCEAATWFGGSDAACVGRTAGSPSTFEPDADAKVAIRTCNIPGCGLQARLDAKCRAFSQSAEASPECRSSTVARNRRILGAHDARLEDFDWTCAPPANESLPMLLACVDDRGAMAPCHSARDSRPPPRYLCNIGHFPGGTGMHMHDIHKTGCEPPPSCLATPGSGWPTNGGPPAIAGTAEPSAPPLGKLPPLPHWVLRSKVAMPDATADASAASTTAPTASSIATTAAVPPPSESSALPASAADSNLDYSKPGGAAAYAKVFAAAAAKANALRDSTAAQRQANGRRLREKEVPQQEFVGKPAAGSEEVVNQLLALGYFNCSMAYDELKDGCMAMRPDYDWLQYAWAPRGGTNGHGPPSAGAQAVSWWLRGGGGADPFDAEAFLKALARLGAERHGGKMSSSSEGKEQEVMFVGDSTARQQTVSLCCLLVAGSAATGNTFRVTITKAVPYMDFRCRVREVSSGRPLAHIQFTRFMRADALPTWRPVERVPKLSPVLAAMIAHKPTVLVLNLGAWEYEDGCNDMHSLHDALCNATRPWILSGYASKWMVIAAALKAAYQQQGHNGRRGSGGLVVWRAATPRDFEGGVAKQGGRCRRRAPIKGSDLNGLERDLNPSSMRFAVLTKNVIMDAVAAQHAPWVRVLDAYGIARQRADAHPGPDPKTNRRGSLHPKAYDDCLHYCLPGVPDLYNGRLLTLMERAAASASTSAAATEPAAQPSTAEGIPGALLTRWNFEFGGQPFVQGSTGSYKLQLQRSGPPTALECPLPSARGGPYPAATAEPLANPPLLGFCSDLDPPSSLKRTLNVTARVGGKKVELKTARAELKTEAGKARRKVTAELLSKKDKAELKSAKKEATASDGQKEKLFGKSPLLSRLLGR